MLYTADTMSTKLNVPDEIVLGNKDYSWRIDWTVNGWLFVATLISGFSDILFPHLVKQWPVGYRVAIVLVQFSAILLWTRALARWIRGMDELHRQITIAAVLFATNATFFFVMLWHRLEVAGLFQAMFSSGKHPNASWDIGTLAHIFLLLTLSYFLGYFIFNRRYK
jgi:hypothetical protein